MSFCLSFPKVRAKDAQKDCEKDIVDGSIDVKKIIEETTIVDAQRTLYIIILLS